MWCVEKWDISVKQSYLSAAPMEKFQRGTWLNEAERISSLNTFIMHAPSDETQLFRKHFYQQENKLAKTIARLNDTTS